MILARYIIRELIVPFILSLSLIILLFVLNLFFQMLGKIAGRGLDLMIIMEFFFLNLAWIVALAVPMAILIANLMAFGRLSADNEITALKSSGVGIIRLIIPALIFSLVIGALLFYFNDRILPDFNHRSRMLSSDIARKKPTINLIEGVFVFEVPNIVLKADRIDGETSMLYDLVIYDESERKYQTSIFADSGRLAFDYQEEKFSMTMYEGTIHRLERADNSSYQETRFQSALFRFDVPGLNLQRMESSYRGDRELTSLEMLSRVKAMREAGSANLRRINTYLVEINKKYSIPSACLVFTLVGVPMGIMFRSGGLAISGGVSIFFFLLYWICLIGGEDLADRGHITPWLAMWFPNFIIMALGLFLIIRNIRGYALLDLNVLMRILPKKWRGLANN